MQLAGMELAPGVNIRTEFPCKSAASPLPLASCGEHGEGGIVLWHWLFLNSSLLVTFTRTLPPAASSKGMCINKDMFILLCKKYTATLCYGCRKRGTASFGSSEHGGHGVTELCQHSRDRGWPPLGKEWHRDQCSDME